MNPKVSVIIRTYNRADLLVRALQSVFNQTFQNWEIIIVDDGSTDQTQEVIHKFGEPRLRSIYQDHLGQPGQLLNLGIQQSRGEYVAILDSDDEWLPTKLEKQVKILETAPPNIAFVSCHTTIISQDGVQEEKKVPLPELFLEYTLMRRFPFALSSLLIKKRVLDKVGPFDEQCQTGEDWDMHIRIANKYSYGSVDEFLLKYYKHDSNISFQKNYVSRSKDLEYLLNRNTEQYRIYPKILGHWYIILSSYLTKSGNLTKARYYLKKNLNLNPSIKNLAKFFISYL